ISAVSALPVHESPTGRIQAHSRNEGKGTQTCAAAFVSGSSMRVTILKLRHCPGCGSNLTAALAKPGIVHAAAARAAEPARNSRLLVILVSFLLLRLLLLEWSWPPDEPSHQARQGSPGSPSQCRRGRK